MIVKTELKSNASGKRQVVAKAMGKQRTVSYDHSRKSSEMHGIAAATVLDALGWDASTLADHRAFPVEFNESGSRATFRLTHMLTNRDS